MPMSMMKSLATIANFMMGAAVKLLQKPDIKKGLSNDRPFFMSQIRYVFVKLT